MKEKQSPNSQVVLCARVSTATSDLCRRFRLLLVLGEGGKRVTSVGGTWQVCMYLLLPFSAFTG